MIGWFAYVRHADVPAREACGWVVVDDLGPVHGHWSVLMRWTGEGEPGEIDDAGT
ncbi:hypothetical protein [Salinarimonas soli]|uniref:hypothetical protein n=1 Tax=Salinarimonas soli TaxID=1638099 RepID=UPI001661F383|nr:hypothetical protein [Salinarimonas soli]